MGITILTVAIYKWQQAFWESGPFFYKSFKLNIIGRLSTVWFFSNTIGVKIEENKNLESLSRL